jgi:hypothetical protein
MRQSRGFGWCLECGPWIAASHARLAMTGQSRGHGRCLECGPWIAASHALLAMTMFWG